MPSGTALGSNSTDNRTGLAKCSPFGPKRKPRAPRVTLVIPGSTLTAIALVFAIFQLNPAPFCLLDEVDAPLDDANTERYTKLVISMSRETQFLFISHNKIAMEMAEQLIGVTMQEQGVSRIVAVDMDSAVSMAEAA